MDKWILSKLNTLIDLVDTDLNEYEITESARALQDFTDILSNWYIRRGRERYWGSEMTDDKAAAYTTLYTVLVTLAKLTAPYTPFVAEMMYQNLVPQFYPNEPISVHLCSFPKADKKLIDKELEKGMDGVLDIVVIGRAARNAANVKNRQPLSEMVVVSQREFSLSEEEKQIILEELNVKSLKKADDAGKYISYKLKPQLKTLGPKYGKKLGVISAFLAKCNASEVVEAVKNGGSYQIAGEDITLTEEDLQIFTESVAGYSSAADKGITVALNTTLNDALIEEGIEREIVSKIQNMRKDAGFEVTDRIEVYYQAEGKAKAVLAKANFAGDVLAGKVAEGTPEGYTKEQSINGEKVLLTLIRK
jgi:isoleucyl-tRNA synthetase